MNFEIEMNLDVLMSGENILYKYIVFSRRMEEVGHPYEYLHGTRNGHTNYRVLNIPRKKIVPGGIYIYNINK